MKHVLYLETSLKLENFWSPIPQSIANWSVRNFSTGGWRVSGIFRYLFDAEIYFGPTIWTCEIRMIQQGIPLEVCFCHLLLCYRGTRVHLGSIEIS
jgi:hypothetical protein